MSTLSTYTRAQMLRSVFIPDLFVPTTVVKICLTSQIPLNNSSVAELVEPTAESGYVAQDYTMGSAFWEESGFGELYNLNQIIFPTALTSWGVIAGWAMVDPDNNEVLACGELLNPFIAAIGMTPALDSGTITIGIYED
jgi:hypothetical protein